MAAAARAPTTLRGTFGTRGKDAASHIELRNAPIEQKIAALKEEADANTEAAEDAAKTDTGFIGSESDGVVY